MSTLFAVGGWSRVSKRQDCGAGRLVRTAGMLAVALGLGSTAGTWAAAAPLKTDRCEKQITGRLSSAMPLVSHTQLASAAAQQPAAKGTSDKPDGGKQKPVPPAPPKNAPKEPAPKQPAPAPKEPAAKEPLPDQPATPAESTNPAPTAEAAKTAVDGAPAADDPVVGEGPDALAKKFAELLEKRRAEAAANAGSKKIVPDPAVKVAAPKPTPPAEPAPAAAAAPAAESVPEPTPQATEEEAIPAAAAPVNEGPPTIDVLVLQTADALADVPRTERIRQLVLTGGNLTNRSMRAIEGLAVTDLSIEATRVSNTGIQYLRSVQGVHRLRLWTPEVDDTGLSHLAVLESLEVLDIEGTSIQGGGLVQLKGLPNLASLVMGPKATDDQLVALQELPALSQLDLRACPRLTLACLDTLAQLKNLKTVWLPSHIRAKGKRVLGEALPGCEVRS